MVPAEFLVPFVDLPAAGMEPVVEPQSGALRFLDFGCVGQGPFVGCFLKVGPGVLLFFIRTGHGAVAQMDERRSEKKAEKREDNETDEDAERLFHDDKSDVSLRAKMRGAEHWTV